MRLLCDLALCVGLSAALWLVYDACTAAAPLPPARRKPVPERPPLGGDYDMAWGQSTWRAAFWPGGDYAAYLPGTVTSYAGRWSLEGDRLVIRESCDGGPVREYAFDLLPGRLEAASGSFRLVRR